MRLLMHQAGMIVVEGILIANGTLGRLVEAKQLLFVAGTQIELINHLRILAGVERVLTMVPGIAHAGRLTETERDLAIGDLKVAEGFQRTGLEVREKEERREVPVHAAHHGLNNRTTSVALTMGEPAILAPPFVFARS